MRYERRQTERVKVNLEASWEGVLARCEGLIVDISLGGCFILTSDCVKPSELVRLDIQLPNGGVCVWGEVVYQMNEIGFGVRFTHLSQEELEPLTKLINSVREKKPAAPVARPHVGMDARA